MPARITVRAELQSLLNKSQALTDANRLAQLDAERKRREELAQLAAKRRKAEEAATRRKQQEDPVGRNRLTAAMGQRSGVGIAWISNNFGTGTFAFQGKIASGNGQAVVLHSYDYFQPEPTGSSNIQVFSGAAIVTIFPAPSGLLVILSVVELFDISFPDPTPGPSEFVGRSFGSIKDTQAYLVTQTTVTEVPVPGFNLENQQTMFYFANKVNAASELQISDWFPDNFAVGQVGSIITTPSEIGGIPTSGSLGIASPQFYLVNDAYNRSNYLGGDEFLTELESLRDAQLGGFTFPDNVPVTLASSSAVPTEDPFAAGWDPVIGYDFGRSAFVAAKYSQMVSPPPPP
jgi:hypothetical protein